MKKAEQPNIDLSEDNLKFIRKLIKDNCKEAKCFSDMQAFCAFATIVACYHNCTPSKKPTESLGRTYPNPPMDVVEYLYTNNQMIKEGKIFSAMSSLADKGLTIIKSKFRDKEWPSAEELFEHITNDVYFKK